MDKVKSFKYQDEEFTIQQTDDCKYVVTDEFGAEGVISVSPYSFPVPANGYVEYRVTIGTNIIANASSLRKARDFSAEYLIKYRLKPITQEDACEIAHKEF